MMKYVFKFDGRPLKQMFNIIVKYLPDCSVWILFKICSNSLILTTKLFLPACTLTGTECSTADTNSVCDSSTLKCTCKIGFYTSTADGALLTAATGACTTLGMYGIKLS